MNLGFGGGGSEFQIPVLSAIVGMIADLMRIGLQVCYEFTSGLGFPNYVIAIVVLTILIKTLLLPLAVKQIRSMKAMQAIQPEIQKIQKKYRNDPAMMRQEMGRLDADTPSRTIMRPPWRDACPCSYRCLSLSRCTMRYRDSTMTLSMRVSSGLKVWQRKTARTSCLFFPPRPRSLFPGRRRRKTRRATKRRCFS